MNEVIEQIYATGEARDGDGRPVRVFPSGVRRETGEALYRLVLDGGARRTLETGMGYGVSTLFICQAHRDRGEGEHTAIDPNERTTYRSIGLLNLERAGLAELVRFLDEPSSAALPRLVADGERFELAFIDGWHVFDSALVDFFFADRLLAPGGHVAIDDLWLPSVRRLVAYARRNRGYELVALWPLRGVPSWRRAVGVARRFVREPLALDRSGTKLRAANTCLLRKPGEDRRGWDFHRSF